MLANSIGLVDEAYRGEILVRFKIIPEQEESDIKGQLLKNIDLKKFNLKKFKKGDRIAQLVLRKTEKAEYEWVEDLSGTQRGVGGFGSTGS